EAEFLQGGCLRSLGDLGVESQVAARPKIRTELTCPVIECGIQMLSGQHGLREDIAERGTQPAPGRVDMALPAFEPHLHREVRFGARGARCKTKQREKAM